jgi:hypothetical protein
VIDTLCETSTGLERRLIGAALGENYSLGGRTYTGRHWWGKVTDGIPSQSRATPLCGSRPYSACRSETALRGSERPSRSSRPESNPTVMIVV